MHRTTSRHDRPDRPYRHDPRRAHVSGHRPGTWARALLTCCAVACVAGAAGAQTPAMTTDVPLVGIHFQDLLPTDGDTVEVFIARPRLDAWDGVALSSTDECAGLGRLGDPGPGHVLVLEVMLGGASGPLAPGETCTATIFATFTAGDTDWESATALSVTRLAHPPLAPEAVMASLSVDRVALPSTPGSMPLGTALFLTLTNGSTEAVELLGLAAAQEFEALVGSVHQSDQRLAGSLEEIEAASHPLTPTTLDPGASTNLALVLDPGSRLPDGSGVITVQPAVLVRVGDATYSLRFERLSTAWGNELP